MDPGAATNPYRAPQAEVDLKVDVDPGARLATRMQRFGGAFVDGGLRMLIGGSIYLGMSRAEVAARKGNNLLLYTGSGPWGYLVGAAVLGLAALQWYFITTRGQSLGKMLAHSRIVRLDGTRADFLHGVVLRNWLMELPGFALPFLGVNMVDRPAIGYVYGGCFFVGILMIYGASRRCLHDRIADTKVIDLALVPDQSALPPPVAPSPP